MSAPERIWAEMQPYDFSGYSPCWVWHHPESLEDGSDGAIEYVRADICTLTDERVKALEAENEQLRAVVNRAGALAIQRASHAFIIDALSRYEGGLRQDEAMRNRAALRDVGITPSETPT